APLTHLCRGQGHRWQLAEQIELGQAQGVVLVGLAFEVLELPGLAGGVGDQTADAERAAQVVNPASEQTGLADDNDGRGRGQGSGGQEAAELAPRRLEGDEAKLARGRVAGTGDALVFAEVDGENESGGSRGSSRDRSSHGKLLWGFVVLGDRDTLQVTTAP